MSARGKEKPNIGWREWVGLPDLGVRHIKAKIDTGARTSALHAYDLEFFRRRRVEMVRFKIHPLQRETRTTAEAEAVVLEHRQVKSSNGVTEERVVISTTLRYQEKEWPIELSLTSRDTMGFRMLLGREAIRGRYAVDAGRSFLGGRPKKKGKKNAKTLPSR